MTDWDEIYVSPTSRMWQHGSKGYVVALHMGYGTYWVGRSPIDPKFSGPYSSFEAAKAACAVMEG